MIQNQKHLFHLGDNHHYLNCSFLSPMPKTVEKAGIEGIRKKNRPWEVCPDDFFTDSNHVRALFSNLINANDPKSIAIMPSVSYGMGVVAANLPVKKNGQIVIAGEQFPSNVYPWMRFCKDHGCELVIVHPPGQFENRGKIWNEKILDAINSDTLLVAISNVHWTDGTRFDIEAIGKRARSNGSLFVIDGTQSVGALPFDVQKVRPDALICAGYKWLMGPYGISLGYFGPALQNGIPLEEGWITRKNSRDFAGLVDYEDDYEKGAERFDMGERSNFINVPMMAKSLKQILEWKPERIQQYCNQLCSGYISEWREKGFFIEESEWRGAHMFGIRLPESISVQKLQEKLIEKKVHVSVRGSAVRVSAHLYNDRRDLEALHRVLISFL